MSSSERFGFEWDKYQAVDSNYEKQFKNWTYPLGFDDFKDKIILDAGCGMGRNSFWPLKWGAKELMAFDFDERSVKAAQKNLADFPNAQVVFKSIYEIDWRDKFDLAFSIGVIHHLKKPKDALQKMIEALKSGGTILVWVYSYNTLIVKVLNPIRKSVTSKLPLGLVHFLAYFLSVPIYIWAKIFRGPGGYLKQISQFKFWHIHSIIFDQLIPEVANYWTRLEVEELFAGLGLREIDIHRPPNGTGWIVIAKKA
mgnify:CR=1 FL=1